MHLRPAARFVNEAKTFDATITLYLDEKRADAKVLQEILALGARPGDRIDMKVHGRDAKRALSHLREVFDTLMREDAAKTQTQRNTAAQRSVEANTDDEANLFCGIPLVEGIAVAPLRRIVVETTRRNENDFDTALETVLETLRKKATQHPVFEAQAILLEETAKGCRNIECFKKRVTSAMKALEKRATEAKRDDYRDMLARIESAMGTQRILRLPQESCIAVAEGLLPSDIDKLPDTIEGLVLTNTSPASHTAILVREHNLPALILPKSPEESETAVLDAQKGCLRIDATPEQVSEAIRKRRALLAKRDEAYAKRHEPAFTSKKRRISVLANVADLSSAYAAQEEGAEGIGLLRTEFLFDGDEAPDFETQRQAYETIFDLFDEVTVRTLDIGGDKPLPYVELPEENNPFLGMRGIRLLRTHPELFKTQLHALFSAAKGRSFKLMFPMIATPEEFDEAKAFAQEVAARYRLDIGNVRFGMMLEVPSVLFDMEAFNTRVDFYSIGTNDLTQYLFALERTHPVLHTPVDHPILIRVVEHILRHTDKPVGLCGELAAHPAATRKLVDAGLTTFSVNPSRIAELKERIRHV
jgi:phosphocarrier protein FPr